MEVGNKFNPQRSYRWGFAPKGIRQHIIKTNNPSTIGPDELLTVRFPDLKENQVIIPSTTKLTFNISLVGTDVNRTLAGNLGRNIISQEFSVLPPWTDHAYNMTGTLNRRRPMYQHRCNSHFVNLLGLFYSVEDTCTFE